MQRDWKQFFKFSFRALKGSFIGLLLVPVVYIFLNINEMHSKNFFPGMIVSTRIGLEIVTINFIFATLVYSGLYIAGISKMMKVKESVRWNVTIGLTGMAFGLLIASLIESHFFDVQIGVQGISSGMLIGGIIYMAFILNKAYKETKNYNLVLRAQTAEANLNVLKNQMQPHFLFNSLNSLAELIESNREFASQMTQKLSDLYREILESSKNSKSSLGSEISIVTKYLELESLRFGPRLQFKLKAPSGSDHVLIPSLILQTLVENAVKHGISQNLSGGFIELEIMPNRNGLLVELKNTSSASSQETKSSGTGLTNTKSRLDLFYGNEHNFTINIGKDQTIVQFWISGV